MNCYFVDATFYQQCICASGCPECRGFGFIPVSDVTLSEMQLGLSYRIRIYGSDIVSCIVRKLAAGFSCQYIYTDGFGFVSERSAAHTIRIPWSLIESLKQIENPSKGMKSLTQYLRGHDIESFSLSDLACEVGSSVYEMVWTGILKDFDIEHGTQLYEEVICNPKPLFNRGTILINR